MDQFLKMAAEMDNENHMDDQVEDYSEEPRHINEFPQSTLPWYLYGYTWESVCFVIGISLFVIYGLRYEKFELNMIELNKMGPLPHTSKWDYDRQIAPSTLRRKMVLDCTFGEILVRMFEYNNLMILLAKNLTWLSSKTTRAAITATIITVKKQ